jgi:hypothetical protein
VTVERGGRREHIDGNVLDIADPVAPSRGDCSRCRGQGSRGRRRQRNRRAPDRLVAGHGARYAPRIDGNSLQKLPNHAIDGSPHGLACLSNCRQPCRHRGADRLRGVFEVRRCRGEFERSAVATHHPAGRTKADVPPISRRKEAPWCKALVSPEPVTIHSDISYRVKSRDNAPAHVT